MLKKLKTLIIWLVIFGLAAAVRLYRINNPVADWHSWRQADTAAVTRYYIQNGIDLLRPRFSDLSAYPSGLANPQGYRMVEFPFINALTAWLYHLPGFDRLSLVVFSRLVSILFSLGSIALLFLIVRRLSGRKTALLAALFMAALPFNVYYSRTILPEVPLVFFSLAAIYAALNTRLLLAGIFGALALLLKPYAVIFALPIGGYLWSRYKSSLLKNWQLYLGALIAVLPLFLWRRWIMQFPEGIPSYQWLLNSDNIRFKGAWLYWLFAERLGKLILGYWGMIFFGLGLVAKKIKAEGVVYYLWSLGLLIYFAVVASGNVHHDYYQIIAVPIVCIWLAKGTVDLLDRGKKNLLAYGLLIITLGFMLAFSWYEVRGYYNVNHWEIVAAGQTADRLLPPEAKVIAPYSQDTAFLYQINRSGWPVGGELEAKIKAGATHYISVNFDQETNDLMNHCQVLTKTNTYVIIDISACL
jgi:4-amino-4-deoxy-L-arabinose transferase-like glycosyltransferase